MSDPVFGIGITRIDEEPRPAVGSDQTRALLKPPAAPEKPKE